MRRMKPLLPLLLSLAVWAACAAPVPAHASNSPGTPNSPSAELPTVAAIDVARYMGTWYEIANYPNFFQRKCAAGTQATYSLIAQGEDAGRVQVLNRCRRESGEWIEAAGVARQLGGETSARLKVRFAPAWLSFIPLVWGNYWVIDLDPAYQLVAVSEPTREYLWILSRTPQVAPDVYEALLQRLVALGFDVSALKKTPQP